MMRRRDWEEIFPQGKLYYETVHLQTLEMVAKYSFFVHKSVNYLDLSLREFSSLTEKRKVLVPLLFCSADPAYSKKFVCTHECCRKTLILPRRCLYTLHLDLPVDRENPFVSSTTHNQNNFWKPKTICFNKFLIKDNVYQKSFRSFIKAALDRNGMEMNFVRRQMALMKRILDIKCFELHSIEDRILNFLYPECTDSEIIKEFLSIIDFHSWVLTNPKHDVFNYLAYHAYCARYDLKLNDSEGTLVNECFFSGRYQYAELLLKYQNAPFYYSYDCAILISSWMRRSPLLPDHFAHYAGNQVFPRDIGNWRPEELAAPFQKGLINKRRFLLWLQIVYAYLVFVEKFKHTDVAGTLGLLWRSLPDAFFTLKEVITIYDDIPKLIPILTKIHEFYIEAIGTDIGTGGARSLQQYCRVTIRKSLCDNLALPFGLSKLELPDKLEAFIKLER